MEANNAPCTVATICQENVDEIVSHVRHMSEKFDFSSDADNVREQVEESANLLGVELSEEEIVVACDLILAN